MCLSCLWDTSVGSGWRKHTVLFPRNFTYKPWYSTNTELESKRGCSRPQRSLPASQIRAVNTDRVSSRSTGRLARRSEAWVMAFIFCLLKGFGDFFNLRSIWLLNSFEHVYLITASASGKQRRVEKEEMLASWWLVELKCLPKGKWANSGFECEMDSLGGCLWRRWCEADCAAGCADQEQKQGMWTTCQVCLWIQNPVKSLQSVWMLLTSAGAPWAVSYLWPPRHCLWTSEKEQKDNISPRRVL